MKVIKITLEDLHALQEGWGLLKSYEELGPPCKIDNCFILKLESLDAEIQKMISTKQLSITLTELPNKGAR